MKIIGIAGFCAVGKDTFADMMSLNLTDAGYQSNRFAFANFIRKDLNDFTLEHLGISAYTTDREKKKIIRPLLIEYGEAHCKLDQLYWCKRMKQHAKELGGDFLIISDVRRKVEAEWIAKQKGIVFFLKRKDIFPNDQFEIDNTVPLKNEPFVHTIRTDIKPELLNELENQIDTITQKTIKKHLNIICA